MDEIAERNGYLSEEHNVTTSDGYILGVWRIPGKFNDSAGPKSKPPVLLMHGIENDMMNFVFNYPHVAPAFVLAEAGYDVWIGNNRGSRFSQHHKTLKTNTKEFWDFDWEDMGT